MARFTFNYSVMNSGKSLHLLQVNHNYITNGRKTVLIKPVVDTRGDIGHISSRLGVSEKCILIYPSDNIMNLVKDIETTVVLVDEAQFLSKKQVIQLSDIVDELGIDVIAYGLKTDAFGSLFEGSSALLIYADKINEIKQLCHCGAKATMHIKYDLDGNVLKDKVQIDVGYEEKYKSVCRKHWKQYYKSGKVE